MKKWPTIISLILAISLIWVASAFAEFTNIEEHGKFLYPIVRISYGSAAGSGTVVYSGPEKAESWGEDLITGKCTYSGGEEIKKWSTYVLTNYHVVEDAISINEEWSSDLQKQVKKEKRDIVYVEFFQYRNLSIPIGTLKIEADIVLYNESEDIALVKTRSDKKAEHIAILYPKGKMEDIYTFDETIAVGCALGFPPIPTWGMLTRKGFQLDSHEYWMSSSQTIYGNSGGAMFLEDTGELIGIPSLVAVIGWGTPITHMGLFIPIERIYNWLEKEHYDFIYDLQKTEKECLEIREKELKNKRKNGGES